MSSGRSPSRKRGRKLVSLMELRPPCPKRGRALREFQGLLRLECREHRVTFLRRLRLPDALRHFVSRLGEDLDRFVVTPQAEKEARPDPRRMDGVFVVAVLVAALRRL